MRLTLPRLVAWALAIGQWERTHGTFVAQLVGAEELQLARLGNGGARMADVVPRDAKTIDTALVSTQAPHEGDAALIVRGQRAAHAQGLE